MKTWRWGRIASVGLQIILCLGALRLAPARAQGLGGAGTVQGTVKDPTGGVMVAVTVDISNPVTGFKRSATTDAAGRFVIGNLAPNPYRLEVTAQGFNPLTRDVGVRSGVPIDLELSLQLAGTTESVQVVGKTQDLTERDPTAHTDVDRGVIDRFPIEAAAGLNQVITLATPGVVADSNGFFHPVGDHAQTQFSIDNQPVTDQQSRIYSNQISADAVQSMELITGVAPAEYGDKTSLIVHIVTKSGLDQKPSGTVSLGYGTFKTPTFEANIGMGSHTIGNFLSISGTRTDRFLDPPELTAVHDTGNKQSFFDRLDVHPTNVDTLRVNIHVGRSSFDIPNTSDIPDQSQHQNITTINVAPGYSRVIGSKTLLTVNGFVRHDKVDYLPSSDPFNDTPATLSQNRTLTNLGAKADLAYTSGAHNVKVGGSMSATKLNEKFSIGFTDPTFNSPCLDADGNPLGDPTVTAVDQCSDPLSANPNFDDHLALYDLSRNGRPFVFNGAATVKQQAAYIQDEIVAGNASIKLGLRLDHYDGLSTKTLAQPRLGVAYAVPVSGTVLRASWGRTMETPYNENLLLSAGYGASGALVGTSDPPPPGVRNEGELGIQQGFGRWVLVDFGYFNKHTNNAYDFNVLFNTPLAFPVAWDHSRLNGFTGRINLVEHRGFSAFTILAHTNAIYSPPGVGGVLLNPPPGDFRIDHDQKFNQTTNVQYTFNKPLGAWAGFVWRYDSGLVASSIGDVNDLLNLTADQQAAIHMSCGGVRATLNAPITACDPSKISTTLLKVPAAGTGDILNNPARVAPRHLFDLGLGVDNVLHTTKAKLRIRASVINLTNKEALYNFLSSFSGTHFVTPRAFTVQAGVAF
jgi:carboxypeptidase family protein